MNKIKTPHRRLPERGGGVIFFDFRKKNYIEALPETQNTGRVATCHGCGAYYRPSPPCGLCSECRHWMEQWKTLQHNITALHGVN